MIGMDHGRTTIEPFHPPGHENPRTFTQKLFKPDLSGVKEGEGNLSGLIECHHPIRQIALPARRREMRSNRYRKCHDARTSLRDPKPTRTVDNRMRQNEWQIADPQRTRIEIGRYEAGNQAGDFRADSVKGRGWRKERV